MFGILPTENNLHIFSFLKNDEIARKTTVNKLSNFIANDVLQARVKDYNIGREELKKMCLANTKIAKIGLQADADRSRYLLLINDLKEIGLSSEDMAFFMVNFTKLYKRLDKSFLAEICTVYPKVATSVFNNPELRGRIADEDIFNIIEKHPQLFSVATQHGTLLKKINKQAWITKFGMLNEEIASQILVLARFERGIEITDPDSFAWGCGIKYEKIATYMLNNGEFINKLDAETIVKLGQTHLEAAKTIIENQSLCAKLSDMQLNILQEKVIEHLKVISIRN